MEGPRLRALAGILRSSSSPSCPLLLAPPGLTASKKELSLDRDCADSAAYAVAPAAAPVAPS